MSIKYPTPLADRVIILPDEVKKEEPKAGAFFTPEQLKDKPRIGTVKAVGIGLFAKDTGIHINMELKNGDRVLYNNRAAAPIEIGGIEHLLMKQDDVVCKL